MAKYYFCNADTDKDTPCSVPVENEEEKCWICQPESSSKPFLYQLRNSLDVLIKSGAVKNPGNLKYKILEELINTVGSINIGEQSSNIDEDHINKTNVYLNDVFEEDSIINKIESANHDSIFKLASLINYINNSFTVSETLSNDPFGDAFG